MYALRLFIGKTERIIHPKKKTVAALEAKPSARLLPTRYHTRPSYPLCNPEQKPGLWQHLAKPSRDKEKTKQHSPAKFTDPH